MTHGFSRIEDDQDKIIERAGQKLTAIGERLKVVSDETHAEYKDLLSVFSVQQKDLKDLEELNLEKQEMYKESYMDNEQVL